MEATTETRTAYARGNRINAIYEDRAEVLWIASGAGLKYFNREKKELVCIAQAELQIIQKPYIRNELLSRISEVLAAKA